MHAHDGTSARELADYRAGVDAIVRRYDAGTPLRLLLAGVETPGVRYVFDGVPGGPEGLLRRVQGELRGYRPSSRSNASGPAALLRILLLQQIDVLWWSTTPPFPDDAAVYRSPQLVSLEALRRDRRLGFRFKVAPTTLAGRARSYALRRWAHGYEPRSSGLSFHLARPAMVGLLNDVARQFAEAVPGWRRGLWVNCLVRSVTGQLRLRDLGYSALLPSSHCVGFAADIEMNWLRDHGVARPLQEILVHHRRAGVLNVIDEGQAWHVCLNPTHVGRYERAVPFVAGGVRS